MEQMVEIVSLDGSNAGSRYSSGGGRLMKKVKFKWHADQCRLKLY